MLKLLFIILFGLFLITGCLATACFVGWYLSLLENILFNRSDKQKSFKKKDESA